jgi:hypothetical protein
MSVYPVGVRYDRPHIRHRRRLRGNQNVQSAEGLHMTTETLRIKNISERHHWKETGGYNPSEDGADPQWGRTAIRCGKCGETRRIFVSIHSPLIRYGCVRKGNPEVWRKGDLLELNGVFLEQFVRFLPNGDVLSHNDGGRDTVANRDKYTSIIEGPSHDESL